MYFLTLQEDGEDARTALTSDGAGALTLDYASPEQLRGEDITTATDNRIVRNMANRDPLTGLANRRVFEQALDGLVEGGEEGALLLVDVDDFKQVNDSLGHQEGDRILRLIATIMQRCVRNSDLSSRIGGDEFALLLRRCGARTARTIAERICSDVARATDGVSVSIGLAMYPEHGGDTEALLASADRAMYLTKTGQRTGSLSRRLPPRPPKPLCTLKECSTLM